MSFSSRNFPAGCRHPLVAALIAVMANWAHAQEQLPTVTVQGARALANTYLPLDLPSQTGSRLGLTARETAATINIVDREAIDASGARTTLEVLQSVPGMIADAPPGGGGSVSMRGFSSSQIMQLFNGIDVAYVIAAHPVDSWLLDRVEVLGGAASFLYGQGAVGGVVNYVSKTAHRQPLRQEALLRAGSFGAYQLAYDIDGAVGNDDSHNFARLVFSHDASDGYVERTDGRSTVLSASWLADLSPRLSHTLAYEFQTKDHQPYWGTPLLNPTVNAQFDPAIRFKNYNAADGAYEQTVHWLRSMLEYRPSERTQVTNTLYFYDAERDYRNVETYRFTPDNSAVIRSSVLAQKHGQSIVGNRLEAQHKGEWFGRASVWSLGADFSRNQQTRYPTSLSAVVGTVDPVNFAPETFFQIPGVTPATNPDRDNRVWTQALYAENHTRLGGSWSLLSGMRIERIKIDAVNHRAVNAANPAYFERRWHPLTGRLGAMYEFSPKANAYLTYSTAADPPSGILSTANFGSVQDWDLTTGRQLELGSKFDFLDGRGNAAIAAYKIIRKNLAMPDPDNPNLSIPVGRQSSRGLEFQAGVQLTPTVGVRGDLALVDARYDIFVQNVNGVGVSRAGNTPTFVPDRIANLHLTWKPLADWTVGLEARYVAARWGNVENTQRFAGYTLFGVSLAWQWDKKTSISLRARNLGDEEYVASGSTQPRLGEPRALEIVLRTRF